jgi:hypothetical protein
MMCAMLAAATLCASSLPLAGCGDAPARSGPGPDWPRNGSGIAVDKRFGTPLPGSPPSY